MRRAMILACAGLLLLRPLAALAWDPEGDDRAGGPSPAGEPAAPREPALPEPPEGVYLVTDVYAGDVVGRSGDTTTYSTATQHEITGSYARVLETVGTGRASAFDGAAFNGRTVMGDGRAVAGTYYENYALTADGFAAVSIVFFQDDSETGARGGVATEPATARPDIQAQDDRGRIAPIVEPSARVPGEGGREPSRLPVVLTDRVIEVLRGRRVAVSVSADPAVRRWRYLSGEAINLGPLSGAADEQFVARWDRLAPPGGTWDVRFVVDYLDGTSRELTLKVTVRSPGLVE